MSESDAQAAESADNSAAKRSRPLGATSTADAALQNSDLEVVASPDVWKLVFKRSSAAAQQMFSVKLNAAHRVYQVSWKCGQQLAEALVHVDDVSFALGAFGGAQDWVRAFPVVDAPDVAANVGDDALLQLECAARSKNAGFEKRTYKFATENGVIFVVMTREAASIAMAAAFCPRPA